MFRFLLEKSLKYKHIKKHMLKHTFWMIYCHFFISVILQLILNAFIEAFDMLAHKEPWFILRTTP